PRPSPSLERYRHRRRNPRHPIRRGRLAMQRFADLYQELDRSTATLDKRAALIAYFREAPPRDAAWALYLLSGGKVTSAKRKIANTAELREWIREETGMPAWLIESSYHHVGDFAETLALLLDDAPGHDGEDI